jgi:hypothetical protein
MLAALPCETDWNKNGFDRLHMVSHCGAALLTSLALTVQYLPVQPPGKHPSMLCTQLRRGASAAAKSDANIVGTIA